MTIENLNLFAIIAMSLTCIIGIALNPPSFHFGNITHLQTVASSLASELNRQHVPASSGGEEYSIRHIAHCADGSNQYYRFTISKGRSGYRAYIDSVPRLGTPLEQLGVHRDGGRYYIDAGKRSSAADAETVAKNWANTQSTSLRIGPIEEE